jgi:hypothetical protein
VHSIQFPNQPNYHAEFINLIAIIANTMTKYQSQHHCQHNQQRQAKNRTLSTIHQQLIITNNIPDRPSLFPLSKLGLEISSVFSVDQHREAKADPQHRVRTSETNGAHTGYTTHEFKDRVIVQ